MSVTNKYLNYMFVFSKTKFSLVSDALKCAFSVGAVTVWNRFHHSFLAITGSDTFYDALNL